MAPRNPAVAQTGTAADSVALDRGTLARTRLFGATSEALRSRSLGRLGMAALAFALLSGLMTHGCHLLE